MLNPFKMHNIGLSTIEEGFPCGGQYICHFCGKQIDSSQISIKLWKKLLDEEKNFYCAFCLRHKYHMVPEGILILTFRGVVAHYFSYLYSQLGSISLSKIEDCIDLHEKVGLKNPLFAYDPETHLWFVDFSQADQALVLETILDTFNMILNQFQWSVHVPELNYYAFSHKFTEAIKEFAETQFRPLDRKILCPTFWDCLPIDYFCKYFTFDYDDAKLFLPSSLELVD